MERKLVIPLKNFVAEGISIEHKIIATYCLIDEMLKGLNVKNDVRAKITHAEILTMAYLALISKSNRTLCYIFLKYIILSFIRFSRKGHKC